tara:strand:- start:374 stop:643 length:270 start_codon:yes stop_codon:yes gene_type:complete
MIKKVKVRITTDCFECDDLKDLDETSLINFFDLNTSIDHLKEFSSIKIKDSILTAVNNGKLVCIENLDMTWESYFKILENISDLKKISI